MAKATTIKVKLVSSADTGFYYVTKKNSRTMTEKLVKKKYERAPGHRCPAHADKIKKGQQFRCGKMSRKRAPSVCSRTRCTRASCCRCSLAGGRPRAAS